MSLPSCAACGVSSRAGVLRRLSLFLVCAPCFLALWREAPRADGVSEDSWALLVAEKIVVLDRFHDVSARGLTGVQRARRDAQLARARQVAVDLRKAANAAHAAPPAVVPAASVSNEAAADAAAPDAPAAAEEPYEGGSDAGDGAQPPLAEEHVFEAGGGFDVEMEIRPSFVPAGDDGSVQRGEEAANAVDDTDAADNTDAADHTRSKRSRAGIFEGDEEEAEEDEDEEEDELSGGLPEFLKHELDLCSSGVFLADPSLQVDRNHVSVGVDIDKEVKLFGGIGDLVEHIGHCPTSLLPMSQRAAFLDEKGNLPGCVARVLRRALVEFAGNDDGSVAVVASHSVLFGVSVPGSQRSITRVHVLLFCKEEETAGDLTRLSTRPLRTLFPFGVSTAEIALSYNARLYEDAFAIQLPPLTSRFLAESSKTIPVEMEHLVLELLGSFEAQGKEVLPFFMLETFGHKLSVGVIPLPIPSEGSVERAAKRSARTCMQQLEEKSQPLNFRSTPLAVCVDVGFTIGAVPTAGEKPEVVCVLAKVTDDRAVLRDLLGNHLSVSRSPLVVRVRSNVSVDDLPEDVAVLRKVVFYSTVAHSLRHVPVRKGLLGMEPGEPLTAGRNAALALVGDLRRELHGLKAAGAPLRQRVEFQYQFVATEGSRAKPVHAVLKDMLVCALRVVLSPVFGRMGEPSEEENTALLQLYGSRPLRVYDGILDFLEVVHEQVVRAANAEVLAAVASQAFVLAGRPIQFRSEAMRAVVKVLLRKTKPTLVKPRMFVTADFDRAGAASAAVLSVEDLQGHFERALLADFGETLFSLGFDSVLRSALGLRASEAVEKGKWLEMLQEIVGESRGHRSVERVLRGLFQKRGIELKRLQRVRRLGVLENLSGRVVSFVRTVCAGGRDAGFAPLARRSHVFVAVARASRLDLGVVSGVLHRALEELPVRPRFDGTRLIVNKHDWVLVDPEDFVAFEELPVREEYAREARALRKRRHAIERVRRKEREASAAHLTLLLL